MATAESRLRACETCCRDPGCSYTEEASRSQATIDENGIRRHSRPPPPGIELANTHPWREGRRCDGRQGLPAHGGPRTARYSETSCSTDRLMSNCAARD